MVKGHLCYVNKIHLHIKILIMESILNLLIFLIFSLIIPFTGFAQLTLDTSGNLPTAEQYKKIKKYEATVNLHNKKTIKGLLYKVTNEEVILIPNNKNLNRYARFVKLAKAEQIPLKITAIRSLKTKGGKGKEFLIGAGIGFGLGALLASDVEKSTNLIPIPVYMIVLATVFGLIEVIFGKSAKSYKLKDTAKLEELKKRGIMFGYD